MEGRPSRKQNLPPSRPAVCHAEPYRQKALPPLPASEAGLGHHLLNRPPSCPRVHMRVPHAYTSRVNLQCGGPETPHDSSHSLPTLYHLNLAMLAGAEAKLKKLAVYAFESVEQSNCIHTQFAKHGKRPDLGFEILRHDGPLFCCTGVATPFRGPNPRHCVFRPSSLIAPFFKKYFRRLCRIFSGPAQVLWGAKKRGGGIVRLSSAGCKKNAGWLDPWTPQGKVGTG